MEKAWMAEYSTKAEQSGYRDHGVFCGECGRSLTRGPFTVITTDDERRETRWLCPTCTELFGLILGHNYASGECLCNGDARGHGYLHPNGD